MISIDCTHPDLEEFIDIKKDLNKVTKANISIQLSDEFMKAVRDNHPFKLYFKREETGEVIEKEADARKLFMKIAENNWEMGEPGCLFWDTISEYNLLSEYDDFSYAGLNPCA